MKTVAAARLLLVRHGQIAANVSKVWHGSTDSPLTAEGERQVARVARHLAARRPEVAAVYASPLQRAHRTATAIASALGRTVTVVPALAEYGVGEFEGLPYEVMEREHRFSERSHGDLDWAPPGGESLGTVATRVVDALRAIATAHPGQLVVAVGHGAAMAAALARLLHDDPRRWPGYALRNTSVTELHLAPAPMLVDFDRVDHLD